MGKGEGPRSTKARQGRRKEREKSGRSDSGTDPDYTTVHARPEDHTGSGEASSNAGESRAPGGARFQP